MRSLQQLVLAIQFLTRIPITKKEMPCEPRDFKGAMAFFTLIGALIGSLQYLTFKGTVFLLNDLMATVVTCGVGIWLTGGLHLDGLADLADAFGANAPKERSLEIMKDSRVGTFGVLAIVMDLFVHVIGIYSLRTHFYLYIFVPIVAKLAVCLLCGMGKSVSKGMGSLWIDTIGIKEIIINSGLTVVVGVILIGGSMTAVGLLIMLLSVYGFAKKCTMRLGGINGDCLGAMSQLTEWGVIIYLIMLIK